MSRVKLLNELNSAPPLTQRTFSELFVTAELITNQHPYAEDLKLEDAPFLDESDRDVDTVVGRTWRTALVPNLNPGATLDIFTYNDLGSSLITKSLPEDQQKYGRLLGQIAFRYEKEDGHFYGHADIMSKYAVLANAEWYLETLAKRTNVSVGTFAGRLGLRDVWKVYANDPENLDTRIAGEFPIGQKVGGAMKLALDKLYKLK